MLMRMATTNNCPRDADKRYDSLMHSSVLRVIMMKFAVLSVFVCASGQQQPSGVTKPQAACGVVEEGYGRPQRPPVVHGKTYTVPKFRLLITDVKTGVPVVEREVFVRYVWRWFEYPYSEHPFGVWSEAFDLVKCATDKQGFVEMPEIKVVPGGWYKGKMLLGRKPEFTHLDVSVHFETHITHVRITKAELERYRKSKTDTITLKVPLDSPL